MEEAEQRGGDGLPAALAAVAVWVRLSAARHLTWNRNYNVKPREISAAQVCFIRHQPALARTSTLSVAVTPTPAPTLALTLTLTLTLNLALL